MVPPWAMYVNQSWVKDVKQKCQYSKTSFGLVHVHYKQMELMQQSRRFKRKSCILCDFFFEVASRKGYILLPQGQWTFLGLFHIGKWHPQPVVVDWSDGRGLYCTICRKEKRVAIVYIVYFTLPSGHACIMSKIVRITCQIDANKITNHIFDIIILKLPTQNIFTKVF